MPNPREKKEMKRRVQAGLDRLHIAGETGEIRQDRLSEHMATFRNWRPVHDELTTKPPLKGMAHYGGKLHRIASYYLDDSGTPEAEAKNVAFFRRIGTEEGMRDFVQTVARDVLSIDLKDAFFDGTIEEAAEYYGQHAQMCEVAWVIADLTGDASDMLDPTVRDALIARSEVIQTFSVYEEGAKTAGSQLFGLIPNPSRELSEAANKLENEGFFDTDEREADPIWREMSRYFLATQMFYQQKDAIRETKDAGLDFLEKNKVDPYTVFKNEAGETVSLLEAIKLHKSGAKVICEKLPTQKELDEMVAKELAEKGQEAADEMKKRPTRDALEKLMAGKPAERKIRQPGKDNRAIYDNFSKEALGAQGKGLQEEYGRLLKTMNGATYWFASASDEFRNMRIELKRLSELETVPNRTECEQSMSKMLKLANKYVSDKADKKLKPREQKRLDAVKAVRDSLNARMRVLRTADNKAAAAHKEAYAGEGASSLANQGNFHVNRFDQKLSTCRTTVMGFAKEEGAIGTLSGMVVESLNKLQSYALDPGFDAEKKGFIYGESFDKCVAEMAVLGVLLRERRMPGDAAHPLEACFNNLMKDPAKWNEKIGELRNTETVKNAVRDIREKPENAANYIESTGSGKLTDMLLSEIGLRARPKAKAPQAPEHKLEDPVIGGPAK